MTEYVFKLISIIQRTYPQGSINVEFSHLYGKDLIIIVVFTDKAIAFDTWEEVDKFVNNLTLTADKLLKRGGL